MKPCTIKLDINECNLLHRIINACYFKYNEKTLIKDGFFDTTLVFATLKPFFLKLTTATIMRFSGKKSFKLSPPELLALYSITTNDFAHLDYSNETQNALRRIYNFIYENGLTKDFYLQTEAQYQARELLAKMVQKQQITSSQMEFYLKNPEQLELDIIKQLPK